MNYMAVHQSMVTLCYLQYLQCVAMRFYLLCKQNYLQVIRVEFDSSSFQLTVIVWMGQVSFVVTTQPELIPEAVCCLKRLLCPEGKSLATIAKCLLPFKKLWDVHFKNVCVP